MSPKLNLALASPLAVSLLACDSDSTPAGFDHVIAPSANDHEAIQTVFIKAKSGDVIGLRPAPTASRASST